MVLSICSLSIFHVYKNLASFTWAKFINQTKEVRVFSGEASESKAYLFISK